MEDGEPKERPIGPGSTLLKALFSLVTILILASMGYATWVVVEYWHRVGV